MTAQPHADTSEPGPPLWKGAEVITVHLPRLAGGRDRATQLLDPHRDALAGAAVVLEARELRSGSASFADQLVREILVEGGAATLAVQSAPERFEADLRRSAGSREVGGRLLTHQASSA